MASANDPYEIDIADFAELLAPEYAGMNIALWEHAMRPLKVRTESLVRVQLYVWDLLTLRHVRRGMWEYTDTAGLERHRLGRHARDMVRAYTPVQKDSIVLP